MYGHESSACALSTAEAIKITAAQILVAIAPNIDKATAKFEILE
jgi:hypothetical protein